jgi:hypothetical protein
MAVPARQFPTRGHSADGSPQVGPVPQPGMFVNQAVLNQS